MKMPMMNGGRKPDGTPAPPVPLYQDRGAMGRQLYLAPRWWMLHGGRTFSLWISAGRLGVSWDGEDDRPPVRRALPADAWHLLMELTLCKAGRHCRPRNRVRKLDGGRRPLLCSHCRVIVGRW